MFLHNGCSTSIVCLLAVVHFCRLPPLLWPSAFVAAVQPGGDQYTTDLYGTHFLYPQPPCPARSLYKLQLLPRHFYPVIVSVDTPKPKEVNPGVFTTNIYFGDLRDGHSSTLSLDCTLHQIRSNVSLPAVEVNATGETLLYVMNELDAVAIPPTNALGVNFTLLTMSHPDFDSCFLSITAPNNTTVTITVPNTDVQNVDGSVSKMQVKKGTSQFVSTPKDKITGMKVTADNPILMVLGIYNSSRPVWDTCLLEFVRPDNTWGKHYFLNMPFGGANFSLHIAAYSLLPTTVLSVTVDNEKTHIKADGKILDLNFVSNGDKSLVTVVSDTVSFTVLFLMISPPYEREVHRHYSYQFRLRALLAVTPVEQYITDPCLYYQLNSMFNSTVVVGLARDGPDSDSLLPLSKTPRTPLGQYWARSFNNTLPRVLGTRLNQTIGADLHRLWFHDFCVIRRFKHVYYLDGSALLRPLVPHAQCVDSAPGKADDGLDNDCDGLVDEELTNGLDDDGDGKVDEDPTAYYPFDCRTTRKPDTWEPTRYRLTRYEFTYYEYAHRLSPGAESKVVVSACIGITMVFVFLFAVWCFDRLEVMINPDYTLPF